MTLRLLPMDIVKRFDEDKSHSFFKSKVKKIAERIKDLRERLEIFSIT